MSPCFNSLAWARHRYTFLVVLPGVRSWRGVCVRSRAMSPAPHSAGCGRKLISGNSFSWSAGRPAREGRGGGPLAAYFGLKAVSPKYAPTKPQ